MNFIRIVFFLIIIVIVLIIFWSIIMKKGNENNKAIQSEKIAYQNRVRRPTQAQLYPGQLCNIVGNDMSTNDPKMYTFYYNLEKHTMGVGIYNKKYVFLLDDTMFALQSEMLGKGVAGGKRLAAIDGKITVTEVTNQTTNEKIKVEDMECFKSYLIEDTSIHYNDNVERKEN